MISKTSSHKICGTCSFWTGNREVSYDRMTTELDLSDRAECASGGGYNRYEKSAGFSCADWEKWGALR